MQSTSPQEVKEWPVVVDSGEPPISNFRKKMGIYPDKGGGGDISSVNEVIRPPFIQFFAKLPLEKRK